MEKEVFLDKLKKLVALGKSKQNALDATEINDFFAGDNLGPEQMDEIYNYLEHSNIDVVPVIDDAMLADDSMLLDDLDDDYREDKDGEDIDLDAIDLLEGIGTEDPVRMYLKEIGTVPLLSADEELVRKEKGRGRRVCKRAPDRGKPSSCCKYRKALHRTWNELPGSCTGRKPWSDQGR